MNRPPFGQFDMSPGGPFEAGTRTTIEFVYTVGDAGLKAGGRIRIGTPNMGWGELSVLCPNPIEVSRARSRPQAQPLEAAQHDLPD